MSKKKTFTVELFTEDMTIYPFTFIAESETEAVTKAMDTAFEQMPDGRFALAGIQETEVES